MAAGDGGRDEIGSADTVAETPESGASGGGVSADFSTPSPPRGFRAVEPGAALGRYTLEAELGAGGMATVYRARDRELRRDVALKILFPHLTKKDEVVRRFAREARAAAGLAHDHILRVYDVGGGEIAGGDPPYIVMELVRGESLRELAERAAPLVAELVACIGAVLCDALAVAHAAGVIHRDVKPANVLIGPGGRLLLADFGVARIEDDDSLVTRTGALLGTPSFMSPEQAQGEPVDARSDLYAVGATLYQLATGSLPYSGPTARVVAALAVGQLVPPLRRAPAMGPDLARAIEALMATDAERRPASAREAAKLLRAAAHAGGVDDVDAELARFFADPAAYRAARTPAIVDHVVREARSALARRELPRAIALADRAAALAPADPAVAALGDEVAAGGRRGRRAGVIAGVALVGAGALAFALWPAGVRTADIDAAPIAMVSDAPQVAVEVVVDAAPVAPIVSDAPAEVALAAPDAHLARKDAGPREVRDAALALVSADAPSPDAALAVITVPDAAPAPAHVRVAMDAWCELTIDGVAHGRADRSRAIELAAGHHELVCGQGAGRPSWRGAIDLAPGQDREVSGSLLAPVDVTIDVRGGDRAIVDGTAHARQAVVRLAPGRHKVEVKSGDRVIASGWVSVPRVAACALRETPELDCY
ncbi:MAG: protein kinase [Deltaproteobacteria bacterium]|nr:protein kinase [Deltaproteobacteria bacterium]